VGDATPLLNTGSNAGGPTEKSAEQDKVLITGDDILIEYVDRLVTSLRKIEEDQLRAVWC
jgi:hypothetical protein